MLVFQLPTEVPRHVSHCRSCRPSGARPSGRASLENRDPPQRAYSTFSPDRAHRFDFWIGEWEVNLRMLQDDLTFEDSVAARASVYSILDGKAILELWDSVPIKGFSLRYYDPAARKWELWLDWPQPNRSRLDSLKGRFRHGRGEFRDTSTNVQGQTITSVYTFSDITPFSLRWDDMYSADGGKSWMRSWVMEFTRTAGSARMSSGDSSCWWELGDRSLVERARATVPNP